MLNERKYDYDTVREQIRKLQDDGDVKRLEMLKVVDHLMANIAYGKVNDFSIITQEMDEGEDVTKYRTSYRTYGEAVTAAQAHMRMAEVRHGRKDYTDN